MTPAATDLPGLPLWADRLIWIGAIVVVAGICIWVVRAVEDRSVARVARRGPTAPARQRGTAIGALATAVVYLIVIAAIVAVVAAIFGTDSLAAISGSAFVLLVLGFATQRLLADVVAGFFILFEGQFAAGDMVILDSSIPMGIVERVGLRATILRTLNGDVVFVPNSHITAAQRMPHAPREMEIGVLVSDVSPVARAVSEAVDLVWPGGARFTTAPLLTRTEDLGDDLHWVRIRVGTPPGFESMAEMLVDLIRARCGDVLRGDPVVADTAIRYLDASARRA